MMCEKQHMIIVQVERASKSRLLNSGAYSVVGDGSGPIVGEEGVEGVSVDTGTVVFVGSGVAVGASVGEEVGVGATVCVGEGVGVSATVCVGVGS